MTNVRARGRASWRAPGRGNLPASPFRVVRALLRSSSHIWLRSPVYVLIDDYDNHGTVTILSSPSPDEEIYAAESRTPYGTEVQIPEGPAKGFAITKAVTGPPRG
jgi:hypothetical protein